MQISVTDTISKQVTDTVQKDTVPKVYYLGNIIPVDSRGKSFPDTVCYSDGSLAKVYTHYTRIPGVPKGTPSFSTDYALGVLSISLLILAILTVTGRKTLRNILSSLSIKRPFTIKPQTGIGVFSWASLLVNFFSMLNASLFATVATVTMGIMSPLPGFETMKIISFILAALILAFLLRHLACLITGSVSGEKDAFREYISVISATWFISGCIFFCISFLILFTQIAHPEFLTLAGVGIFVMLYFYRIIRLLIIFIRRSVTILYFILYLCALEVLPVLLLLKLSGVF
jgi:hypothetical protein